MKKFTTYALALTLLVAFNACEKDDDTTPETPPVATNPTDTTGSGGGSGGGGTTGDTSVVVANVNGLKVNYIKVDGRVEKHLYRTNIGGYESGGENYFSLTMFATDGNNLTLTIKGSDLREGNFSLKKFRLGSNPGVNEAVLYGGIDGNNLMDFETTDANAISIQKNSEDFFVIKMAPLVGVNRNSWDQVITEPISFHFVTNHTKVTSSDGSGNSILVDRYSSSTGFHSISNQPFTGISVFPISIAFRDYDFSMVSTLPKTTYTLASSAPSVLDLRNGTSPKGVYMEYSVNSRGWPQNFNKTQTVDLELTATRIILTFNDIEFQDPFDPTQTRTASGTWEMMRDLD